MQRGEVRVFGQVVRGDTASPGLPRGENFQGLLLATCLRFVAGKVVHRGVPVPSEAIGASCVEGLEDRRGLSVLLRLI